MAWTCDVSIEEKVRQDCYNRGYEQGRKNPCDEIVAYIEELQNQVKEYQDKIEQGALIELPCIVVGNGAIDAFGKIRVPYYQVLWLDEFGMLKMWKSTDKAEAEKRLKELQE